MELLKSNVAGFKKMVDRQAPTEKKGMITTSFAKQFNQLLAQARDTMPSMADQLPPIKLVFNRDIQPFDFQSVEDILGDIANAIALVEDQP